MARGEKSHETVARLARGVNEVMVDLALAQALAARVLSVSERLARHFFPLPVLEQDYRTVASIPGPGVTIFVGPQGVSGFFAFDVRTNFRTGWGPIDSWRAHERATWGLMDREETIRSLGRGGRGADADAVMLFMRYQIPEAIDAFLAAAKAPVPADYDQRGALLAPPSPRAPLERPWQVRRG